MHTNQILRAGRPISPDGKALIMLHGRGASAEDILSLADHLDVGEFSLLAPQAANYTWYPQSFLAPRSQNEPWLSSALELVARIVADLNQQGIPAERIHLLGFSQGACLTLEFAARNPIRYGGIVAFTGGLIGDQIDPHAYGGDLAQTPVFIGTSDPDPHVPVERVRTSAAILGNLNAHVTLRVYPNMGHTVSREEIDAANTLLRSS